MIKGPRVDLQYTSTQRGTQTQARKVASTAEEKARACDHWPDQVAIIIRLDENGLKQSAPLLYPTCHSLNCLSSLSCSLPIGFLFLHFTAWHRIGLGQGLLSHSTPPLNTLTVEAPGDIGGEVLHIVSMQSNGGPSISDGRGGEPSPADKVTLGLLLHGWTLLGRIFLYSIGVWLFAVCRPANSRLIPQARTSFTIHQWLIGRVRRAEPALSGYFSASLFRHPPITSKHDYFYLLDSCCCLDPYYWERRWVCQCRRRQQQALGDMGAGRLASLRWDWVVHTSPVTPLWVLLVWVTCTDMLVDMTSYIYCMAMKMRYSPRLILPLWLLEGLYQYQSRLTPLITALCIFLSYFNEKQMTKIQCSSWNFIIHHHFVILNAKYQRVTLQSKNILLIYYIRLFAFLLCNNR